MIWIAVVALILLNFYYEGKLIGLSARVAELELRERTRDGE